MNAPLAPQASPALPLNRSEWLYVACDGPIGQVNTCYLMRFDGRLDAALAKQALRRLVTAYPRLRAVLEPTARRYRLRILPDDAALDVLVDLAFRVEHVDLDDPEAKTRWQELALNDPLSMQRGLGLRVQFVPHPERPAMMLTVHHLLADGRSMMMCLDALLRLLNGQPIADMPLDSPSMLPAVVPPHWWQWPGKLWASWRANQAEARERARYEIVRLPTKRSERYLSCGVQHLDMGFSVKMLSSLAKSMGGSTNSLLMAAAATAVLDLNGNRPGTAALVRVSVDLRRYFPPDAAPQMGNYVAALDLLVPADVPQPERTAWMDQRMRQGMARFTDRTLMLPLLPYEMLGWLRPHDYARLIRGAKQRGNLPQVSCHTTNIGSTDSFTPEGATLRLRELVPAAAGVAPLILFVSADGQQMGVGTHQRDEFDDDDARALMSQMQTVLSRWVARMPA